MTRWTAADLARRSTARVKNVRKKLVNGLMFDSTKEARRYQDLELMQKAGQITDLRRQVPYPIYIKGKLICEWRADFVYKEEAQGGQTYFIRVEDVKGWKTDIYKLKKKMVEAEYGFQILET